LTSAELEMLQKRKSELEHELKSLTKREETLVVGIANLEAEMAIQSLQRKIKVENDALEELEWKKRVLTRELEGAEDYWANEKQESESADLVKKEQEVFTMADEASLSNPDDVQTQDQDREEEKRKTSIFYTRAGNTRYSVSLRRI